MNNLNIATVSINNVQSMSSLQIAELVKVRHDNVKRVVERLVDQGVISQPQIEDGIKSANGVVPQLFVFSGEQGKLDSITVVAQLCPQFTASIVKRWQELERVVSADNYQALSAQLQALKQELLKQNPDYHTLTVMYEAGLPNAQMAGAVNLSPSTVEKRLRTLRKLGIIAQERGKLDAKSTVLATSQLCLEV